MIESGIRKVNVFAGWQRWEIIYVLGCTAVIAGISGYLGDSAFGIASAITGTLYTMFAGKGRIICYFFGIFNTIAYGCIAREQALYGDMMLNWFIYLPMMFSGILMWRKKLDDSGVVIKTSLPFRGRITLALSCMAGIGIYGAVLYRMADQQPWVDSATTVLSVAAMILTLKRCIEQWLLWILVNALSVVMWLRVWMFSGNSIATLLWWIIMLVTGVIFFIQWFRELKRSSAGEGQRAGKKSLKNLILRA